MNSRHNHSTLTDKKKRSETHKKKLIENKIAKIICVSFIGSRLFAQNVAAYMAVREVLGQMHAGRVSK